ncbi:MAG: signal peptidase I [Deltaproteobacteria bacterium]|nr:signal peptidase I [Deltaproteobacteria bacterium]
MKKILSFVKSIIIALIIALIIRAFVVQAFRIPSSSMKDTLLIGDHIMVYKFIYGVKSPIFNVKIIPISKPKRGDIIVFKWPPNPKIDFIKRCIGLPGDEIKIVNKKVYVNGKLLVEPYTKFIDSHIYPYNANNISARTISGSRDNFGPIKVPPHHYFMMGDNRDNSLDSRYWGFVPEKNILGKAFIVYFSWNKHHNIRWHRFFHIVK